MIRKDRFRLFIFPLLFVVLFSLIIMENFHLVSGNRDSVIYTYASSFLKGEIGSGFGIAQTSSLDSDVLQAGDIILGGYPNCAYGRFSHAGIYIGNGQVLEGFVDQGVSRQDVEHYMEYSRLCILRVDTTPSVRKKALSCALQYEGKCFYPVAFKSGERFWNCSKIIWRAYLAQGINLDRGNDLWIAPESFCNSTHVIKVFEKEE